MKVILENGGNGENAAKGSETPLSLAVDNRNIEIVEILLNKGVDANIKCKGRIPLMNTLDGGSYKLSRILLKYSDVSIQDDDGKC